LAPATRKRQENLGLVELGPVRTIHCDSFYLDVIEMLRRLNANAAQMAAAENRFAQGGYNWRR